MAVNAKRTIPAIRTGDIVADTRPSDAAATNMTPLVIAPNTPPTSVWRRTIDWNIDDITEPSP